MGAAVNGRLLFVLADGGRARFVERSSQTGQFVTIDEIDNGGVLRRLREALRASPPARSHDSQGPARHSVGPDHFVRSSKEAFMTRVAERADKLVRQKNLAGVFVAAPPPLVEPLHDALAGRVRVAGRLGKDLTKSPDDALTAWLEPASSEGGGQERG